MCCCAAFLAIGWVSGVAGAQILAELGVHEMILLTTSHHSLIALEGYGLSIVEERFLTRESSSATADA